MAKINWQALQVAYVKAYAKTGISVQQWCKQKGLNFATAKRYIKKPDTLFNDSKNCEAVVNDNVNKNQGKSKGYSENCETNCETNCEIAKPLSKTAKDEKGLFVSGNNLAAKHSGYARYFKDPTVFGEVVDFGLKDEIDLMRQRAVAAIQSIEQFNDKLANAIDDESRLKWLKLIKSAETALHRAIGRIESLNSSEASIKLTLETIAYRKAQTKETLLKADKLAHELNLKANGNNTVQFLDDF